jgi:hypothetical protein
MPDDTRPEDRHDDLDAFLAEAFEDEPVPALSPAFEARLHRRLDGEARRPLPARERAFLAVYWIAAAAASAAVVTALDPAALAEIAALPWWPIVLTLGLTAAGLAVPLWVVLGRFGDHGQLAP